MRPDFVVTMPDGYEAHVNAEALGPAPGYEVNVGFLIQLDSHYDVSSHDFRALDPFQQRIRQRQYEAAQAHAQSTDPNLIRNIKEHLFEHGYTEEHIAFIRDQAIEVLEQRKAALEVNPDGP